MEIRLPWPLAGNHGSGALGAAADFQLARLAGAEGGGWLYFGRDDGFFFLG
jgi:hypothetical protein